MQMAVVKYQFATYSGEVEVFNVDENDDNECIIAKAKRQLKIHDSSLPMAYESYKVIERRAV